MSVCALCLFCVRCTFQLCVCAVVDLLCLRVSFWLMLFVQLGSHVSMNVLYVYLYSYEYIIYTFMFVLYVYLVCAVCFNCIPLEIDIYSEGSEPDMEVSDAEPECFPEVDYESGHLFDPESLKNLDPCSRPTGHSIPSGIQEMWGRVDVNSP